jgi:hypothetical protein
MVERSFTLLLRIGYFDPIPDKIRGKNIKFEYTSPIKKIREQAEVAAGRLWVQELLELREVKPEVMDLVNVDELARFSARALDLPEGFVQTRDIVENVRKIRAEQLQDTQERDKVAQEAEIGVSAGKAAKDLGPLLGLAQQEGGL